jgi:hypothetical protein
MMGTFPYEAPSSAPDSGGADSSSPVVSVSLLGNSADLPSVELPSVQAHVSALGADTSVALGGDGACGDSGLNASVAAHPDAAVAVCDVPLAHFALLAHDTGLSAGGGEDMSCYPADASTAIVAHADLSPDIGLAAHVDTGADLSAALPTADLHVGDLGLDHSHNC